MPDKNEWKRRAQLYRAVLEGAEYRALDDLIETYTLEQAHALGVSVADMTKEYIRKELERASLQANNLTLRGTISDQAAILATLVSKLDSARRYIDDLEGHEGAEGFSDSTRALGAEYHGKPPHPTTPIS